MHQATQNGSNTRRILLRLTAFLTVIICSVFAGPTTASASAILPSIGAVVFPANGAASVWGSGYTPYGEVHVWVYRNHQQTSYVVTHATSDGSLVWSGAMVGYATCHDEFDVQAYDVGANQLTANPFASLGCAPNPNLTLHASYAAGNPTAFIKVTGSGFAGAKVGLYVYVDHILVENRQIVATPYETISTSEWIPYPTYSYCDEQIDVVAYDYTSHQFSNDPNSGPLCSR